MLLFFSAPAAWFMTNDSGLNCGSKSQDCIGCCFHYPSTHCTTCSNTTDIVLTCSKCGGNYNIIIMTSYDGCPLCLSVAYDLTILRGKGVTGWSSRSTTCSFSGKSLPHSTCARQGIASYRPSCNYHYHNSAYYIILIKYY